VPFIAGVGVLGVACLYFAIRKNQKRLIMEAETMRARQATTATVNVGGPSLLRSLLNFISGAPSQGIFLIYCKIRFTYDEHLSFRGT